MLTLLGVSASAGRPALAAAALLLVMVGRTGRLRHLHLLLLHDDLLLLLRLLLGSLHRLCLRLSRSHLGGIKYRCIVVVRQLMVLVLLSIEHPYNRLVVGSCSCQSGSCSCGRSRIVLMCRVGNGVRLYCRGRRQQGLTSGSCNLDLRSQVLSNQWHAALPGSTHGLRLRLVASGSCSGGCDVRVVVMPRH